MKRIITDAIYTIPYIAVAGLAVEALKDWWKMSVLAWLARLIFGTPQHNTDFGRNPKMGQRRR